MLDLKRYLANRLSLKAKTITPDQVLVFIRPDASISFIHHSSTSKLTASSLFEGTCLPDSSLIVQYLSSKLHMSLNTTKIQLNITQNTPESAPITIITYPSCSIPYLYSLISTQNRECITPGVNKHFPLMNLHYNDQVLKEGLLCDYGLVGNILSAATQPKTVSQRDCKDLREYDLTLVLGKKRQGRLGLSMDFSFNVVRDVHRVNWSKQAPDYRTVKDGM